MKKLSMKYEETRLVDFQTLMSRTTPCAEVPNKEVYPHKPMKNQGRFGSKKMTEDTCEHGFIGDGSCPECSIKHLEKDAEVLYESKHTEGDLEITEKAKYIDETTDVYVTPCGTKVKAKDVINVLEEYYNLTPYDRAREKSTWVELISKMVGVREDGLKIVDIELASNGEKQIKFVYR